ncbi:c-type cytochrome [Eoetvoesiella caeni]|uniref:Cytochrome c n=1 Tax=Eoetvoesiella caeni TaxID=645616 RepID=A0A366H908_9BURK|nr:cytochrome c family protein [Eoetvoesiella caeni]MCI2809489.1 cytochrome c family protein [Eoetvoesiella caeni]NYT55985.1 cytochrome c family protein [Eoetvoesiella caeni]RBP38748.1 cytochrome c [Eoetvoesiella caeni]
MSRRLAWLSCACVLAFGGTGASQALADTPLTGDATRGEAIYSRCLACHALAYDRTGPRHCGLFGRRAGSVPGFAYSTAMKNSKIIWDEKTLNWFLTSPMTAIPGTAMGYAGIPDAQERADLIAYLKKADAGPECASKP